MQRIGISIKPHDARAAELAAELADWLRKRDCVVFKDAAMPDASAEEALPLERMPAEVDLMIVLGGDGTLLHVGRRFIGHGTPILGINAGRLGFLTDTPIGSMFDVVEEVLKGNIKTKLYMGLEIETWRQGKRLNTGCAMNDVVLQRNDHPRMIEFEMQVREQFVFRLRADGIVLATPAGSTAYALSSGGPIVHPEVNAISVVPICPHTLSNRPIVVPADDTIELTLIESPSPAALNLDGQEHMELLNGDVVRVRKSGMIALVYLPGRHYFEVLRSKLHWAGQASE
ncbi:MAG: NAD(+)/NADH kinase [Mariprofundaceae bacterium]|nr:NAD(+)/NADH kinase [Mariprofundaceae bacterium]